MENSVIVGIAIVPEKVAQVVKVIADLDRKNTIVHFDDGGIEVVHCSDEDEYDVYVGVALAMARHQAGSNGKFIRQVNSVLTSVKKKVKAEKPSKKSKKSKK